MLEETERKVEILVQEKDGRRRLQAFSFADQDSDDSSPST
jgi:hypothetical protein